jgi:hypothetical protein
MVALRRSGAACCRRMDALIASLKVRRTAGHGVLPQNLRNAIGRSTPCGRPTTADGRPHRAAPTAATAGHGVLPPVSARPLDVAPQPAPRRGFVQRTLLGGTALGLGVTVKAPTPALGQGIPLPTASPECFNSR